jgi:predicted PurR-regulated permease PerM
MNNNGSVRLGRQGTFWLLMIAVILGFLYLVRGVLLPFVMAMGVAYFFDPLVRRLQRNGLPRWLSGMIVLLTFIVIFVGAAFLVVPVLEQQVDQLINAAPGLIQSIKTVFLPQIGAYAAKFGFADQQQLSTLTENSLGKLTAVIGGVTAGVLHGGLALLDLLSLLLVTPVVAFYMLRDWDRVISDIDACLPRHHKAQLEQLFHQIDRTLSGFIRGQALVCLIQATYYAVALSIAGLDFSALVGIATGILTFIPYLGATIGLITGIIIAIAQWHDSVHVAIIVAVFAFGQIMEANLITPKLVGDRIDLHPAWVIFAVLAGGAMFGFIGILIAVPVAAVIGVLIRFGVGLYLNSRLYKGDIAGS